MNRIHLKTKTFVLFLLLGMFGACKKNNPPAPDPGSNDNSILSFQADSGQVGDTKFSTDKDSTRIFIYVENGIPLNAVKLKINVAEQATIKPASGETIDFSGTLPVQFTVTAQSGAKKQYYAEVKTFPAADLTKYVPNAQPDATYNRYFTRFSGWNSGDGAQSILLPDGRTVWLFGDSFVGQVNPDRSLTAGNYAVVHNALMVQKDTTFTTYNGGTTAKPESLFNPENPKNIIWASHGVADGDKLYVFMMELGPDAKGNWIHLTNHMAVMDNKEFKVQKMVTVPYYNKISWGERCFTDVNYHYIFGMSSSGPNTIVYLARAKKGHLDEMWEFYTGSDTWQKDITQARPISVKPYITAPAIVKRNGRYYMITNRNFFSRDILMFRADKIEGPYKDEVKLYSTPDVSQTYLALAHPQFNENDRLLIGYSLGGDIFKMAKNIDIGRPMFIRVNLPE